MKIALVIERFNLLRGGQERSTYELAGALGELNLDVTLVAARIDRPDTGDLPFKTREVPANAWTRSGQRRNFEQNVTRYFAESDYDIVHSMIPLPIAHVYQPRSGSILYSGKRHAASYECPLMANFKRATSILNRARQAWIANERKLSQAPDGPVVAALSNYVAEQFKTEYGLHENRIHLVRNGVRIDAFRSEETKEQGRRLRQLFDKKDDLAIFLFAADDPRRKGLSWLLKAAAQAATLLTENERDFRIIVIGGKNILPYRRQVLATTIEKRILFLGSTQQMPPLMRMCDAVVLPTYDDPCSRLIMEGLASGKPAITTRYNGAAEFLADGKYGIIIENCPDTTALAQALLRLCDPSQQQKMSQAIESDHLYQQVSMQRHAQELLTLYKKLLQNKIGVRCEILKK